MRQFLCLALFCIIFLACEKADPAMTVEHYMNSIKNDTYNKTTLPDFEPEDIAKLLTYIDDTVLLKKVPVNPISSCYCGPTTAGLYALWTIESIRKSELEGDTDSFQRFPSLNARIISRKGVGLETADISLIQKDVADLYKSWWNNVSLSVDQRLAIDPLALSDYRWY